MLMMMSGRNLGQGHCHAGIKCLPAADYSVKKAFMENLASQRTASSPRRPLTTFVHTDIYTFREVVQRLTGPSESNASHEGLAAKAVGTKRTTPALHERRQGSRKKLEIVKPPNNFRPGTSADQHSYSPSKSTSSNASASPLGTPTSIFSKLSIMEQPSGDMEPNNQEEEKAIRERRFYLHPSPRTGSGSTEPELLSLFPLTSPK